MAEDNAMPADVKKLHRDLDHFYAGGYLSIWCDVVRAEWAEFLDRAFRSDNIFHRDKNKHYKGLTDHINSSLRCALLVG
jgi:hypothetical protein